MCGVRTDAFDHDPTRPDRTENALQTHLFQSNLFGRATQCSGSLIGIVGLVVFLPSGVDLSSLSSSFSVFHIVRIIYLSCLLCVVAISLIA